MMPQSCWLLTMTFLCGCYFCVGNRCYLTSCSYNEGMKWSLPKQHATECSEIAFGGHRLQCPSGGTAVLLGTPIVMSDTESSNMTFQRTSTEESVFTTSQSCETTWINANCSKRCTCSEKEWVCNSTYRCSPNATCMVSGGVGQCICKPTLFGDGQTCKPFYKDCQAAYEDGNEQNGIYTILPDNWPPVPFNVSCDMTTDGGGWTIFQRRIDRQTDFYRNWTSYKHGFGLLDNRSDFWLGNEKLFHLTNQGEYKLRVEIMTSAGESKYTEYEIFRIGDERSNYNLTEIGEQSSGGDAGDGLLLSKGHSFSTYDRDNDNCSIFNCAEKHYGAWWYTNNWCKHCSFTRSYCDNFVINTSCHNVCARANLNSGYNNINGQNINWNYSRNCLVYSSEMKIKPDQQ